MEGTSPALLAATRFGHYVLASDMRGNLEIVGDADLSFERGSHGSLRVGLETPLAQPVLVREHGARSRARVEIIHFWNRIAEDMEQPYLSVRSTDKEESEDPSGI